MANEVIDRDLGFKGLAAALGAMHQPGVLVGILQDKGSFTTEEGITLAGYAAVNEFGSDDGRVPERSFLRSSVDDHAAEYAAELDKIAGDTIDAAIRDPAQGKAIGVLERGLGRLGARAARDVQTKIREGGEPFIENAPYTLERKYPANRPLIHTGRMRQSISFVTDMDGKGTSR